MSRAILGLMLFGLTASLSMQADPAPLAAQAGEKKKKKDAKKIGPKATEKEQEDVSRIMLAFDPGSHTRPISALGFNKDQTRLITVGWDYSIQIWNARTGERLDILRLPAYGRDNGYDSNRWNHAAISADGAFVAIGGGPKLLYDDKGIPTRLLIVDVANRRVRKLIFPADPKSPVTCLSFSANGSRLAVGFGGADKSVYILDDVVQIMKNSPDAKLSSEPGLVIKGMTKEPHDLALSQTGNKLVLEENAALVMSFDVTGKAVEKWKKLGEFKQPGQNDLLAWSPDESHFAWSWRHGEGKENNGIQLRTPECKLLKNWTFGELAPGFGRAAIIGTFRYLDSERLFITGNASLAQNSRGYVGVTLNPKTGKSVRHFSETLSSAYNPFGAASTAGTLAAITTQNGLEAVIFNLADGKVVARCGSRTPVPTIVGWSKDSKFPAVAWSDDATLKPMKSKLADLKYAFDLAKMEPVAKLDLANFTLRLLELGEWKLIWGTGAHANSSTLKQGDKDAFKWGHSEAFSLIPTGADRPLFARAIHDQLSGMGSYANLYDSTEKKLVELLPVATQHRDMVASPDGRYLLVSTGTHRMSIYRTDGSRFPFLNLVQANGEWVCWTPEGYYAASPGGEKMIGWAIANGANEFATFHPVEKHAKEFRRPDVIKLAIEKGSVAEALTALNTKQTDVETIQPPHAILKLVKQTGAKVQVTATASSGQKEKPILTMRLLLDGRPLPQGQGKATVPPGKPAEATWEVEIPGGSHELKLLASSDDDSATSDPLVLIGP
ncbi:MAG: WD40 repeat domain-containing protein, partial [Planctomycetes bacterium]|nr:WD40 repeat domain-containing protein [Planctomycetota bacterium]